MCTDQSAGPVVWSENSTVPRELQPLPADEIPLKQPGPSWQEMCPADALEQEITIVHSLIRD